MLFLDGQKVQSDPYTPTSPAIPTSISEYTYNLATANKWYWADGPEKGGTFYGQAVYTTGYNGKTDTSLNYQFNAFYNPVNVPSFSGTTTEPNNMGNENSAAFGIYG